MALLALAVLTHCTVQRSYNRPRSAELHSYRAVPRGCPGITRYGVATCYTPLHTALITDPRPISTPGVRGTYFHTSNHAHARRLRLKTMPYGTQGLTVKAGFRRRFHFYNCRVIISEAKRSFYSRFSFRSETAKILKSKL